MNTALVTDAGAALIAAALAGGPQVNLTQMAVGTGALAPDAAQLALQTEVYRGALNALVPDPVTASNVIAEHLIPDTAGGWTIQEVGVFTDTGVLFAVGQIAPLDKPDPAGGSSVELLLRVIINVNSPAVVNLNLDSALLASRAWVWAQIDALHLNPIELLWRS